MRHFVVMQGQCPLEVTIKGQSLILLESDLNDAKFKALVNNVVLDDPEKVNLGKLISFVHNHGPRVHEPTWWVTHNIETIKSITIGVGKTWVMAGMKWLAPYKASKLPANFTTKFGFQLDEQDPVYSKHKIETTTKVDAVLACLPTDPWFIQQLCVRMRNVFDDAAVRSSVENSR